MKASVVTLGLGALRKNYHPLMELGKPYNVTISPKKILRRAASKIFSAFTKETNDLLSLTQPQAIKDVHAYSVEPILLKPYLLRNCTTEG
jgi:hypothetical protein